jgi:hypothetical protein
MTDVRVCSEMRLQATTKHRGDCMPQQFDITKCSKFFVKIHWRRVDGIDAMALVT